MTKTIRNILMIDIPIYTVELEDYHREAVRQRLEYETALWQLRSKKRLIRPGLTYSPGLLTLAASLERKGFFVRYLVYADLDDRRQIEELAQEADAICVNAMTPTVNLAMDVCMQVKQINQHAYTILGGPHISARPAETLASSKFLDFVLVGECDYTLPNLLAHIDQPELIPGTYFHDEFGDVTMSSAFFGQPIVVSELPLPAYHLLSKQLSHYSHNIKTLRGCPYHCNFCFEKDTWKSISHSSRSVDQIVAELTLLNQQVTPGTMIHFADAIFNIQWANRTAEIVERIKAANFNLVYSFDTRADLIEEAQVKRLVEANFLYFRMGFESTLNMILNIAKKDNTHEAHLQASSIIRSVSSYATIHAYMLTGLPGSTIETLIQDTENLANLVERDVVDAVGNKIFVPYPGTNFHEQANLFGIEIITHNWSKYDRRSRPVYNLATLASDDIYHAYVAQEYRLVDAYRKKLDTKWGIKAFEDEIIKSGLDYKYMSYVSKGHSPN